DGSSNDGFATVEPWLPMEGTRPRNLCDMQKDKRSILHLYRQLILLRRQTPAFRSGDYAPLRSRNDVLAFERFTATDKFQVALNLTREPRRVDWLEEGTLVLSTHLDRKDISVKRSRRLRPAECGIVKPREHTY